MTPWTVTRQPSLSMGILQARILEWVTMPSSRGSSQPKDRTHISCIAGGFFTLWAPREAHEHWNGLPCPPPGYLCNPGIEPRSPALQADSLPSEPPGNPKNTRVGSLTLLKGIFPIQESKCRRILYQLSFPGSHTFLFYISEFIAGWIPKDFILACFVCNMSLYDCAVM